MTAPDRVLQLVERFAANLGEYRSGRYNEAQVRQDFIDPFFEALGWDVGNRKGYSERYREVVPEASIKIGSAVKAPDYSFRVGGDRRFFVEAKKPAVPVGSDISAAYQLRRYAWSAHLPLSILTDFEEFAVYDCRKKPAPTDKPSTGRIEYFTFDHYPERWADIAGVFSPEAIMRGAFDRYAEATTGKRGTAEVDDEFLRAIESWRTLLAKNLALRNPGLTQRELNVAVQTTIDRIIFLRICEDRGIEEYGRLLAETNGAGIYGRLCRLFQQADARYNSGLFHFAAEKGWAEAPDTLTLGLAIDDKPLKDIIRSLYYPESPYEFSVLSSVILGQVYEQFLGQVIRLTTGHRAVVEMKPEVKKAGGVRYTPTYISGYLVRNTLGVLLAGKTPRQVAGMDVAPGGAVGQYGWPVQVLDNSCGSGSILVVTYQNMLDWHLDWYNQHLVPLLRAGKPATSAEVRAMVPDTAVAPRGRGRAGDVVLPIYQGADGEWRLTTAERKRILLTHIFGVDIDPQAVEVTKLSLLLKVLEGENEQTLGTQLALFQERVLPDLGQNIKCGNSLIGPEFYDGQQLALLDDQSRYRINAFDWHAEFPQVFGGPDGGFDVIAGNPPYVRIQVMKEWAPLEAEYYKRAYVAASKGNYDIYAVFVERGLSLLSPRGRLGFILPHKFFNAKYGEPLRDLLARGRHLAEVVHFGDQQVFRGATTYTCLMFLDKAGVDECRVTKAADLEAWRTGGEGTVGTVPAEKITAGEWNLTVGDGAALFDRLSAMPVKLGDVADVFVGLQTSADDVFIMNVVAETRDTLILRSKALGCEWTFEKGLLFPLVSGTDVGRYRDLPERQYILFPYHVDDLSVDLIGLEEMATTYPRTADYLARTKLRLEGREKSRLKGHAWHGYIYLKNMRRQSLQKLCVPRLVDRLYAALDAEGNHFLDNVDVGGITLRPQWQNIGLPYLLGLLNSRVLRWYFPSVSAPFRGGYLSANRQFLSKLPIRTIDFSSSADVARHDEVVGLVDRMLAMHRQLAGARTGQDRTMVQRQIDATDRQIDRLVYGLYGLTDEEIAVVERGSASGGGR